MPSRSVAARQPRMIHFLSRKAFKSFSKSISAGSDVPEDFVFSVLCMVVAPLKYALGHGYDVVRLYLEGGGRSSAGGHFFCVQAVDHFAVLHPPFDCDAVRIRDARVTAGHADGL